MYVVASKSLEIVIGEKEQCFVCFIKANIQAISEKYLYIYKETRLTEGRKIINIHNDVYTVDALWWLYTNKTIKHVDELINLFKYIIL